ncbi:MAG: RluA family pseudouridine synthase [Candidatus Krumholzibacteriota bacterium]|nr:RluA family pseudouridine synthase [Candidatus Krumholzibacteriota bacterium]
MVHSFVVDEEQEGERIDSFLGDRVPELSRSRVQKEIRAGGVLANGAVIAKSSHRVREGDRISLSFAPPRPPAVEPEDIPLAIVYEDSYVVVVDKAAGMVVHPAPGHARGTLVNALLHHCGDLSGIGGVLRPGIVHRLDAGTTGLLVAAKNDEAHISLSRQLMERSVSRIYRALVWGSMPAPEGVVDRPVGRSPRDRRKMAVVAGGKPAVTSYSVLDTRNPFQYIVLKLGTGRTHQIRVHLSHEGHPVLGDPEYGGRRAQKAALRKEELDLANRALALIDRQALHAAKLAFTHPRSGERMRFASNPPADMAAVLDLLGLAAGEPDR